MKNISIIYALMLAICSLLFVETKAQQLYREAYRPQVHFSPKAHWMNDPNGMVFYKGTYNLFFQYYPDSTVWGPMHWGHATSKDLLHWQQQPIALYPDSLGYIFSGSAVIDYNNTSGFGKNGQVPMVAIFTHHDPIGEAAKKNNFQNQSLAYSLDEGKTWTKYAGNPVLKNPGIVDFRDPKVMWYAAQNKWVMTLATKDRISFYSSPDLKNWSKESEFGETAGAHGGVWECPDLFTLNEQGKKTWVLIVNLNPGGPNKGSATQYFIGDFDGHKFIPSDTSTKWLDYGPDEYAGITWFNTGERKIFLGWMSNWLYANVVPTVKWRNALTIPRELALQRVGKEMFLSAVPIKEINTLKRNELILRNVEVIKNIDLTKKIKNFKLPATLDISLDVIKDFSIELSNGNQEKLLIGFDKITNQYFIDRTNSGITSFQDDFAARRFAPRLAPKKYMQLRLVLDKSSVELFADNGLSVMTAIFFATKPYDKMAITTPSKLLIKTIKYAALKSIWP